MRTRRQMEWAAVAAFIVTAFFLFRLQFNYFSTQAYSTKVGRPSHYEAEEPPQYRVVKDGDASEAVEVSGEVLPTMTEVSATTAENFEPTPTHKDSTSPLPDRIVVMGKIAIEDTSWVSSQLPDWQNAIYTVDSTNTSLHTSINKGNEANPYLTYLVTNYDTLPSTIVFLHAHRDGFPRAWHTDAVNHDNVEALRSLNINFIQRNGYANLRCIWDPGCPAEVQSFRDPPETHRTIEAAMPKAWRELFGNEDVPNILATPCCSQFAVSREQVLKRPIEDYQRYLDWLIRTELDDDTSGRVFEYLWHVIFGQDPVYCPELTQCYCDVYGRC
ncbi:uncharacterized protein BDR25DRAFT_385214 [Lindgomyces ingoldianus]|uniref:Uncharacterized protein n=1 Tax=Lindgomyces ingoldianus TaxID=673940 RepID=A0ACB6QA94_9PLEO|nr:uncharacterized protein BDR25DRAFT_385214 [Lindgomyces ingoldianus]KAF2463042.1 hypothetical protein BDR25DRAFT_385214 [Lindgomyces ingoldianus]